MSVCVCVCVRACVSACVSACVRVCVCVSWVQVCAAIVQFIELQPDFLHVSACIRLAQV